MRKGHEVAELIADHGIALLDNVAGGERDRTIAADGMIAVVIILRARQRIAFDDQMVGDVGYNDNIGGVLDHGAV